MTMQDVANGLSKYKSFAMHFTKNESFADDVLQEVFLKINRKYEREKGLDFLTYKGKINDSYMFLVVRSCYHDILRKEKRYTSAALVPRAVEPIEPNILDSYLKGLTWYEKELTKVYYEEEHSIRSLAKATNIGSSNIYLTLKKTKRIMKERINQDIKKEIAKHIKKPKTKITKRKPSKGLGDDIEMVLQSKPLKKVTEVIKKAIWKDNEDCGCEERKKLLNELFPRKHIKCMTEQQYKLWEEAKDKFEMNMVKDNELKIIAKLHSELFQHKYFEPCRCDPKTWILWIKQIDEIYNTYENG